LIIELTRTWAPDEMGEEACPICSEHFELESVVATAVTDDRWWMGHVCQGCIEHMGRHPSGRFPTIEEYRDALARFPGPIWAREEELDREDAEWKRTPGLAELPRV
jgi:hypothetical protein